MSARPHELQKVTANHWAKIIATQAGKNEEVILQGFQLFQYNTRQQKPLATLHEPPGQPERVGIWRKQLVDGQHHYMREIDTGNEWHWWANKHWIPPKSAKARIVLIGESVARGYFYDPHVTIASVLETYLNSIPDLEETEVIDLARTNLQLVDLVELTSSAVQLEPDIMVIFAGNNWVYSLQHSLSSEELRKIEAAFENTGFSGVRKVLEGKFKSLITAYTTQLAEISKAHSIPIVFIIPEFNLADWHSVATERLLSYIPAGGTRRWVWAKMEAERAFKEGEIKLAEQFASSMIEIDESHPLGYELLAQCKLRQGLHQEAKQYLEQARDTAIFTRSTGSPRILSMVRETLLLELAHHGITVVDLSEVFSKYLSGALPGRELFLDYCHLTLKGIQISMIAAAQSIGAILTNRAIKEEEIKTEITIGDEIVALANICAAVHNAHWGQDKEIQQYLCKQTVKLSKIAAKVMLHYVDFASRRSSTVICKSYEQLRKSLHNVSYAEGTGFLSKQDVKLMDLDLVDSMIASLLEIGIDLKDHIHILRKQEHGGINGKIDLLEPYYHATSYEDFRGKKAAYFQARDLKSKFILISEKNKPVSLNLTYRVSNTDPEEQNEILIKVNDSIFMTLPITQRWKTCILQLPSKFLVDGINSITFEWPIPDRKESEVNKPLCITSDFLLDKMFPVTGEIHSFHACIAE